MKKQTNLIIAYVLVIVCSAAVTISCIISARTSGYMPVAVDGIFVFGCKGGLINLLFPLILVYSTLYRLRLDFDPVYVVRRKSKIDMWNRVFVYSYVICIITVFTSMVVGGIITLLYTHKWDYMGIESIMYGEFAKTGYAMPQQFHYGTMFVISLFINSAEVFVRVLIALGIYWFTESQVFTIIMIMVMRIFLDGRMAKYFALWHYKVEGGAYYTELCSGVRIMESILYMLIAVVVIELLAYIFIPRKNFYK